MNDVINAITTGTTAFIATNIDDILILMLFFAQINDAFRPKHIVRGQYLGFSLLILASLPGFLGGLMISKAWIGLLGIVPIAIGIQQLISRESDEPEIQFVSQRDDSGSKLPVVAMVMNRISPQTYQVAAVTVANGGDNIGIYVPLFASSSWVELGIILVTFYGLVRVWCYVAYWLTRHPAIASILTRRTEWIMPIVLIGLGLWILFENETYTLFPLG